MASWDPPTLSKRFEFAASSAETYFREIRPKMVKQPTYQHVYDEKVAEFCVFNRLHGRTFLDTRDALLAELRSMRAHPPRDATVNEQSRFERFYGQAIDRLISEFETEAA
jgi:hypothetical protein